MTVEASSYPKRKTDPRCPSDARDARALRGRLLGVYARLEDAYGPQHWWPGQGGFETIAGAILTQSAAWSNVERALDNLRATGALHPARLLELTEAEVAVLVRPSGYFNAKARKLRAFAAMLASDFDGDLAALLTLPMETLRARLLATYGIGPETADDIVLYAAGRPSFVIDAYTRRIFGRLRISPGQDSYEPWRHLFMAALPADARLFNEYHALIVRHAKVSCRTRPICAGCTLIDLCPTGQHSLAAAATDSKPSGARGEGTDA